MMSTLSQTMNELKAKGHSSGIDSTEIWLLDAQEWKIDEIYRFEGNSNPSDNSILFTISKNDETRKELIFNAYGIYSNSEVDNFTIKLEKRKHY